ncbi:hypothetical protein [Clostridium cuniculi]|uniref:hypothetical protein n=1 Tax=Clostridium cuniculi TaxID=2548455 RepID=UPI00140FC167|nr:hypothetical protein [Clostridium cuniculi]
MRKYKISAFIGIIIMGISSFMACVSDVSSVIMIGNIGLVLSILIMSYGFYHWQQ